MDFDLIFMTKSVISAVIGTILPGPGSIIMKQDLNFTKPSNISFFYFLIYLLNFNINN